MSEINKPLIEKFLGSNWRTSLWAILSGIVAFIATYPELLSPIPDYWEDLLKKAIAFLIGGGLIKFGLSSSDKATSKQAIKDVRQEIKESQYEKF